MGIKTCTMCNIEKRIHNFYINDSEREYCNIKEGVRFY